MIEVERLELAGIPCITLRNTRVQDAPAIIHYHGWTGNKGTVESPDQSLVQLASVGFLVVAPDCYEHGERATGAWSRAQFNSWAFICQAMDKTRQEAGALFEAVMTLPYASARNPQVTGGSMGGLIAQMVFAENQAFSSMVSVVGRSSFYQADDWCRQAQAGTWCDDWCAEYATQSHPERFTDRPLLFTDARSTPIARPKSTRKPCGASTSWEARQSISSIQTSATAFRSDARPVRRMARGSRGAAIDGWQDMTD